MYIFTLLITFLIRSAIHCGMNKPRTLKTGRHAAHLNELNDYLAIFTGLDATNKCFGAKLNKNLLYSTTIHWVKHTFLKVFGFKYVPYKK